MPPVLLNAVLFVLGLIGLFLGADWLVGGAGRLARSLGVAALVVALTVVAFGTSAPELVVGVVAAARGDAPLALGNVIGSNVMNIALILGISSVVTPVEVAAGVIRREIPMMILLTGALGVLGLNTVLGRGEGIVLLALFFGYLVLVVRHARAEDPSVEEGFREFERPGPAPPGARGTVVSLALIAAGVLAMFLGARALVASSVFFARVLGLSEFLIGLTVVAIGTSLPELATCLMAVFRRKSEIAVGNIVGSNVFNVCAILGVAALVAPIPFPRPVLEGEYIAMFLVSFTLLPLARSHGSLSRREGVVLLALYVAFTLLVFTRA